MGRQRKDYETIYDLLPVPPALKRFLTTREPADFQAALQEHGPVVLANNEVQKHLTGWHITLQVDASLAQYARFRHQRSPDIQVAREALSGIGKALLPPKKAGRPRELEPDRAVVLDCVKAVDACLRSFRRAWRSSPTQDYEDALRRTGVDKLISFPKTRGVSRNLLSGSLRQHTIRIAATLLSLSCWQVRQAIKGHRLRKSGGKR
jgi:hypothetical protein